MKATNVIYGIDKLITLFLAYEMARVSGRDIHRAVVRCAGRLKQDAKKYPVLKRYFKTIGADPAPVVFIKLSALRSQLKDAGAL